MNVIIVLIIASILVAGIFLFAFIFAVKDGQFDDTYSPSRRILFEDSHTEEKTDGEKQH